MPEAFLFLNPDTNRCYRAKTLNTIWKKYSGISAAHYEASRHSFCTQIVEGGADVLQAKELLRHADIRSTQKYFHGSVKKLRDIVNRRGQVVEMKKRKARS